MFVAKHSIRRYNSAYPVLILKLDLGVVFIALVSWNVVDLDVVV